MYDDYVMMAAGIFIEVDIGLEGGGENEWVNN